MPKAGQVLRTQNLKSKPQRQAALSSQTAAVARNGLYSTSRLTAVFVRLARMGFDGLQLQHPRSVLKLVARVKLAVIWRFGSQHRTQDFEPAHTQATQSAGVALTLAPVRTVINLRPVAVAATEINPQMHGGPQEAIALSAKVNGGHLAGLVTDRRHARVRLQPVWIINERSIHRKFRQQARRDFGTRTGQGFKQGVVGMLLKTFGDQEAMFLNLLFKGAQQGGERHGQHTFGLADGVGHAQLHRPGKSRQPLLAFVRLPEPVGVQKVFPLAFARFDQCLRCRKRDDKRPRGRDGPVVKRGERGGIVFIKRLLELVHQRRALFDEQHFIAAQQPQLLDARVGHGHGFPVLSFHAQGGGQGQTVNIIGFVSGGLTPLAIRFGTARVNVENQTARGQELFDSHRVSAFDRDGDFGKRRQLFPTTLPAIGGVVKAQACDHFGVAIQNQQVVMILRPIKTGEVCDLLPCVHNARFLFCVDGGLIGCPVHRQPNTAALLGRSSLRRLNTSRRRHRFTCQDPRRVGVTRPCWRRGKLAAGRMLARNRARGERRGQVIHSLPASGFRGRLRSAVNSLVNGIRRNETASAAV